MNSLNIIWNKIFKNGPSEICGRQPLKNLKWYGLPMVPFTNTVIESYKLALNACPASI